MKSRYIIKGEVIHGRQLGRRLGFPTANISLSEGLSIPFGVYLGRTLERWALVNVGCRPTVERDGLGGAFAEVWIMDFGGDLYGSELQVELFEKLRDEQRFDSVEELRAQIERDKGLALELISAME